jgi:hypothetical protein
MAFSPELRSFLGSVASGGPWATPLLARLTGSEARLARDLLFEKVREGDSQALAAAAQADMAEVVPLLVPLARSGSPDARFALVKLRGSPSDLAAVVRLALGGDHAARAAAVLRSSRCDAAILVHVLRHTSDTEARRLAVDGGLSRLGHDAAWFGADGPLGVAIARSFHPLACVRREGVGEVAAILESLAAWADPSDFADRPVRPDLVVRFEAALAAGSYDIAAVRELSGHERLRCETRLLAAVAAGDSLALEALRRLEHPLAEEAANER